MLNNNVPGIEDIGDASRARMVLYQGQRAVHAPLSSVRDVLDLAPYVETRAALLDLDATKDLVAFVMEASYEGLHQWDGTDLSGTLLESAITSTAVDSGTETVTSAGHGLRTGDAVIATTAVNGLSLNTLYWVIRVDDDDYQIATTLANALAGTELDLTGTTNFSVQRHIDPEQTIYVTPTTAISGASGAWIRTGAAATGVGYTNASGGTARIHRWNDRLMVGDATLYNGRNTSGGDGGWLFSDGEGATKMSYLLLNAGIAAVGTAFVDSSTDYNFPYGVVGAVRLNGASAGSCIGVAGYGKNDGTGALNVAWGGYFEGKTSNATGPIAYGLEVEAVNNSGTDMASAPGVFATGLSGVLGIGIGSGGGVQVNPNAKVASAAIMTIDNPSSFKAGIVLTSDSLYPDGGVGTAERHALLIPKNSTIEWHYDNNARGFYIKGNVSDSAHAQSIITNDTGLTWFIGSATGFHLDYIASSVNYLHIAPSATLFPVVIQATGTDTNIDLRLITKGTGVLRYGTHTALGAETVTGYITIKDNGGTVRKIAVVS